MKKVLIFLMLITAFTVATPLNADCYSTCDSACDELLNNPDTVAYWMSCLRDCYGYCVSIGAGGGSGGNPFPY